MSDGVALHDSVDSRSLVDRALLPGALAPAYQPIVDLFSERVVGFEALARWPQIAGASPAAVFEAARTAGSLVELDWACRLAAIRAALAAPLDSSTTLFVNVEPATIGLRPPLAADAVLEEATVRLRVVLELTERALLRRPADLLRLIEWARTQGWGIAIDDVGAHPDSLALLPFVSPDVVKLDLALIQRTPSAQQARTMAAVMSYAERTGASLLAEGIETPAHREQAISLGARYGQGWLLGRPGPLASSAAGEPVPFAFQPRDIDRTPFELVSRHPEAKSAIRVGRKRLLLAMSRHIEQQGLSVGDPPVVLSAFQTAVRFTPDTAQRYAALARSCPFVGALGVGLTATPTDGVRGASLDAADPLAGEWTVVIVGAHYAGALIARDLGDHGLDHDRRFEFVITHDRDLVLAAGRSLMHRMVAV